MKKNNSKRKRSTNDKPNKGWIWALYILAALAVIFMIYIFMISFRVRIRTNKRGYFPVKQMWWKELLKIFISQFH